MFENLRAKLNKMQKTEDNDVTFKSYEETREEVEETVEEKFEEPISRRPGTPMVANTGDADSNIELKVICPASFDEVSDVADHLLAGRTVVLNLELLDHSSIVRMLDFLNGVTYSTDGDIKNVSKNTFIITPHNVDVSDDE